MAMTADNVNTPARPVGYCSPPVATRFKPGQSGNPRGRPPGSKSVTGSFNRIMAEQVAVREGERVRFISKTEALMRSMIQKAMQGDPRAVDTVLNLALQRERERKPKQPVIVRWIERDGAIGRPDHFGPGEPDEEDLAIRKARAAQDGQPTPENSSPPP